MWERCIFYKNSSINIYNKNFDVKINFYFHNELFDSTNI